MNRALRAATVGVLLLTPVALTACGAGQVSQTATQIRDKTGPAAQVGDLSLRQVMLAYPRSGQYSSGDDAVLNMSIANSGPEDDALIGISGDDFSGVKVTGSGVPSATSASPSGASPGANSTTGGASGSSTGAGGTTSAEATNSNGTRALNIPIPAGQTVFLGENSPTVTLGGLSRSLTPGQYLKLTFTFRKAGAVTMDVTVAAPTEAPTRSSSFDFSQEATATSGGNG